MNPNDRQYIRWGPIVRVFVRAVALFSLLTSAVAHGGDFTVRLADSSRPLLLYRNSYALVIGIDGYTDGWGQLYEARKDAVAVADELKEHGFEVTLKTDKDMRLDKRAIELLVEDFIYGPGANRDARLLIWFAGHGHTIDGEGYIVPQGAPSPASRPKEKRVESEDEFRRNAISLRSVGLWMREVKSRHMLAIFDSCFGGTVFDTARAPTGYDITEGVAFKSRQFVSSGDAQQVGADD